MSTHKITLETKVPFPCWMWRSIDMSDINYQRKPEWVWEGEEPYSAAYLLSNGFTHYCTNPPDQPPLGEPAPEEATGEETIDLSRHDLAPPSAAWTGSPSKVFSDQTPAALSLQSVAAGAAKTLNELFSGTLSLETIAHVQAKLLADIAPFLTERDERIARLEKRILDDNKAHGCELRDPNGTIWEYADSLRTRIAELEEDKAALEKEVMRKEERFISCASHLEGPNHCQISEPGNYIHLLKIHPDGSHVSMWKKTIPSVLREGETPSYPCAEWKEWMKGVQRWPLIPFKDYQDYKAQTAAIRAARKEEQP